MPELFVAIDLDADPGEKFAPEVVAEIAVVAPSAVLNGSITTAKLADDAVTQDKVGAGAVGSTEIASGGVDAVNLADSAVTTPKLTDASVTPAKTGTGVVTAVDSDDNSVETVIKFVTAAQYSALTPDPNTVYMVSD